MLIGTEQAYRAVAGRDTRFDGCFVFGVRTTGIYCRPSCPSRTPKPTNIVFLPTAAAAQEAGYRACRRCLPDAVPGSPEWDLRADLVGRAMRLINDGVIERSGVHGLADQLGYSARHVTRTLRAELGAGPLALARARRAHSARVLIERSGLPFTDIAFAAGFASLRQFNDTVREVFATTPSAMRETARQRGTPMPAVAGSIRLRLPFRAPFDADGLLRFLGDRAVPGVEAACDQQYARSLRLPHGSATVRLTPNNDHVDTVLRLTDLRDLGSAVTRLRRLLDLDADPWAIQEVLGADPVLAGSVARNPGVRVPGATAGDEIVVRAVLGQQVSVAAARTAAGKLAAALGEPLAHPDGSVTRLFPNPEQLAEAPEGVLTGPRRRVDTLRRVCQAMADGSLRIHPGREESELRGDLLGIPGIGPWTAGYVAMRVLGAPDVLLDTDLALKKGATVLGIPPQNLRSHSKRWSPWRSYAGMHFWRASAPLIGSASTGGAP